MVMMNKTNRRSFFFTLGSGVVAAGLSGQRRVRAGQAPSKPDLRFAIASDGHFGQEGTDYKRFHDELIRWVNEDHAGKGLDFIVFNGDLIHNDPALLPELKTYFDRLAMPYYVVKGNHDMAEDQHWSSFWGTNPNYSFEKGGYGFIFAYTSNSKGDYLCADIGWLESQVEKYRDRQGIFVFMHIAQSKVTRHSISCPKVEAVLCREEKIKAVFHGHDHDIDNKIYVGGKPFFFDGHCGGSWGTNYRGYRVVEVRNEEILTYQCNPNAFYENVNRI